MSSGRLVACAIAAVAALAALAALAAFPVTSFAVPPQLTRVELSGPDLRGLSGLARDGRGVLHAVPERSPRLVTFTSTRTWKTTPIEGAPFGADLESLAWISGDTFAIGTEILTPAREGDRILFARLTASELRIEGSIVFGYGSWSMRAAPNAGIEGLCAAAGILVAASETAGTHGPASRRFAPVGAYDLEQKRWRAFRVYLTSERGKISALTCRVSRAARDRLEVFAIERHYETMRILRFELPIAGTGGAKKPVDLEPELYLDLAPLLGASPPNFEGIEWTPDERALMLLSDNDYGGVSGAAVALFIR